MFIYTIKNVLNSAIVFDVVIGYGLTEVHTGKTMTPRCDLTQVHVSVDVRFIVNRYNMTVSYLFTIVDLVQITQRL